MPVWQISLSVCLCIHCIPYSVHVYNLSNQTKCVNAFWINSFDMYMYVSRCFILFGKGLQLKMSIYSSSEFHLLLIHMTSQSLSSVSLDELLKCSKKTWSSLFIYTKKTLYYSPLLQHQTFMMIFSNCQLILTYSDEHKRFNAQT